MCGRYAVTPGEFSDLRMRFKLEEITLFNPSYNIAPTQQAPVITKREGTNRVEQFRWGLVPFWARDISIGNRMPVMLNDDAALAWMNYDALGDALSLLKPFPAELMDCYEVSGLEQYPNQLG